MSTAHVRVEGLTHRYGSVTALRDVDLAVEAGEFVTLLGPSGCGKTTLLRAIAGFERPTSGRIFLGDDEISGMPAHRRPVNMVFQRPTLFPHLDVFDNVGFGLRLTGKSRRDVEAPIREALALVRLEGFEHRRSHELSGGQMQRVALARALVKRPQVLLLDEPLSALDLKIRLEMEVELRRVHRETGATFIYVTHDQREALALSDRVAVFNNGRIEQFDTPEAIYNAPESAFAARFVGDANVIPVEILGVDADGARVALGDTILVLPGGGAAGGMAAGTRAMLVVRPELLQVATRAPEGSVSSDATVEDVAFRGTGFSYRLSVAGLHEQIKAEVAGEGLPGLAVGERVSVTWPMRAMRLLAEPPTENSEEAQG